MWTSCAWGEAIEEGGGIISELVTILSCPSFSQHIAVSSQHILVIAGATRHTNVYYQPNIITRRKLCSHTVDSIHPECSTGHRASF